MTTATEPAAAPPYRRRGIVAQIERALRIAHIIKIISDIFTTLQASLGGFYVNDELRELLFEELQHYTASKGVGGFLPAMKQIANVAALPGIVKTSVAMPDPTRPSAGNPATP